MKHFNFIQRLVLLGMILFAYAGPDILAQSSKPEFSDRNLKGQSYVIDGIEKYRLIVKFSPEAVVDIGQGKLLFSEKTLSSLPERKADQLLDAYSYRQVFSYSGEEKALLRAGKTLQAPQGKFNRYPFRGMVYVQEAEKMDKHALLKLANEFEKYEFVEYATLEPVDPIIPPSTPDLSSYQLYKHDIYTGASDVYGIDAEYAWSIGITGQGVKIADIEWGYDFDHEDLVSPNFIEIIHYGAEDHGTAVAGIMYAKDNGFGMTGMVHGADKFYGVSEIPYGRVYGIGQGLLELDSGDVFLYEMQTGGQSGNYVPADYNIGVWDITKSAAEAGIIVVAAAGNGDENLDDSFYNSYRARGDNGSIRVGAGTKVGRNKAYFSTYGSPIHVQGWGDWTVATTGYGGLYNGGAHATYVGNFSGTSAATPIVASAVVAIQSYAKNTLGMILTPLQMRDLLIATGTAQGSGGHIGPLPNIKRAIEFLTDSNYYPLVSIAAPVNNAAYTAPATVNITVNASDSDGSISKVEFFLDTTKVGEKTSGPYTYSLFGVPQGSYALTARATDNKGAVSVSLPVMISVAPAIPLCSGYPAWNSSTVYINDTVSHLNVLYRAKWYTIGLNPTTNSNTYDVWENLGACSSSGSRTTEHFTSAVFTSEGRVLYPNPTSGMIYWGDDVDHAVIYNMAGGIVEEVNADVVRRTNLSGQPKGMYMARVTRSGSTEYVKIILK